MTNQLLGHAHNDSSGLYRMGAFSTIVVLAGIIVDIAFGIVTGGDLTSLPQTAIGRFEQLQQNPLLGLYNLDLLNMINQLFLIPAYVALYIILRETKQGYALLSLIIFLVGTVLFVINNSALAMLELSSKYAAADASQKLLYAAAGEAMLVKGAHGSFNVFLGFLLPNVAGCIISIVMLQGNIFTKWTAYLGIVGSLLISLYIVFVTFIPEVKTTATAFAAPAGIMLMVWMILFTRTLLTMAGKENNINDGDQTP